MTAATQLAEMRMLLGPAAAQGPTRRRTRPRPRLAGGQKVMVAEGGSLRPTNIDDL